ncbi:MAG: hypothetical protein KF764_02050 [Labilithrix sp.]|nr:hypothetical protein [Labilithrix sp.]
MPIDLASALPYLSPTASEDDTAPLYAVGSLDAPVTRVFSTTLIVTYMIDEPGARVFVRARDVDRNRRDELHARALDNLRAHAARRKLRFEPRGPTHVAKLDGEHDASLLLLDELWDPPTRVADPDGELVAVVPSRGTLVFGGSATRGAVPELRATLSRLNARALSPELFVRRAGAWETLGA